MYKREILATINNYLGKEQIILITGARQVGKTTLLFLLKEKLEKELNICFYLNLENPEYKEMLNEHPDKLFEIIGKEKSKKIYLFLDEIQYLDNPSNFLKYHYDENRKNIKIICTGSSNFYLEKKFKDSLAGRKFIFELYGLSFFEYLNFKQEKKILKYRNKKIPKIYENKLIDLWKEYIQYGSYPEVVLADNVEMKKRLIEELALAYIKKDILEAGLKESEKYFKILRILASQTGQLVNLNDFAKTLNLSVQTVEEYLRVMQKSYHLALIKPFYSNIKKELTKMQKVYFFDLGLRNYLLNNFELIEKRIDKGDYLENIIFLKFLAKERLDNINFWRTQNKNEVDFIINRQKAYEVKFDKKQFRETKYKNFMEKYPDIKLKVLSYEVLLSEVLNGEY